MRKGMKGIAIISVMLLAVAMVLFSSYFVFAESVTAGSGYGSSGLIAFVDEASGEIYHPWWNTSYASIIQPQRTILSDIIDFILNVFRSLGL